MQRLVAPPGAACAAPLRLRPCRARRSARLAASASAAGTPTAVKATLRRPLGIVFAERGKPGEAAGVRIDELTPGGNAASAGLQIGDVLVRVSATLLKDGKEGQYEKEGYGQRPYTNWSRQMIDVRACDFETIMNAISSNNERWGIMDVVLELERGSGAGAGPVAAPEPMAPPPPPPPAAETLVELEILSPQGESTKAVVSGEAADGVLRDAMLKAGVKTYDTWGSMMNCNGGGQCGLCTTAVVRGAELLGDKSPAEGKLLKNKPADWRLACQTTFRKGAAGEVVVQAQPQGVKGKK